MKIKKNIAISETGFIFDPNTGESFSVNDTGKAILKLLKEEKNEKEIISWLTNHYDVDRLTAENNLNDFLSVLKNFNIIE